MSDFFVGAFSMTGTFSTRVSLETFIRTMQDGYGLTWGGQDTEPRIDRLLTEIFTGSSHSGTWRNEGATSAITWELRGPPPVVLKFRLRLWKSSRPDTVEEEPLPDGKSPQPSPASPAGGNGPQSSSRQLTNSLLRLADAVISSGDQEMIQHYEKLLLFFLSQPQRIG